MSSNAPFFVRVIERPGAGTEAHPWASNEVELRLHLCKPERVEQCEEDGVGKLEAAATEGLHSCSKTSARARFTRAPDVGFRTAAFGRIGLPHPA